MVEPVTISLGIGGGMVLVGLISGTWIVYQAGKLFYVWSINKLYHSFYNVLLVPKTEDPVTFGAICAYLHNNSAQIKTNKMLVERAICGSLKDLSIPIPGSYIKRIVVKEVQTAYQSSTAAPLIDKYVIHIEVLGGTDFVSGFKIYCSKAGEAVEFIQMCCKLISGPQDHEKIGIMFSPCNPGNPVITNNNNTNTNNNSNNNNISMQEMNSNSQ